MSLPCSYAFTAAYNHINIIYEHKLGFEDTNSLNNKP